MQGPTLMTVLEKAPPMIMAIAANEGCQPYHDRESFGVCKELRGLRLVSKRASETFMQVFHCYHLTLSDKQCLPSLFKNLLGISKSLTESKLTDFELSMIHTRGVSILQNCGTDFIEHQLETCLQILSPALKSVTHLKLTTRIYSGLFQNLIATGYISAYIVLQLIFRREPSSEEVQDLYCTLSTTKAALLAKACCNVTHLAVDFGMRGSTLELLGKHCPKITSFQFLDHYSAMDHIQESITHFPQLTHIRMRFWSVQAMRTELLSALSASPTLTHLTQAAGWMVSMKEWTALPKGLREIKFGGRGQENMHGWFWLLSLSPVPPEPLMVDEEVGLMLGLEDGQLQKYAHTPTPLVCKRISASHPWVCQ